MLLLLLLQLLQLIPDHPLWTLVVATIALLVRHALAATEGGPIRALRPFAFRLLLLALRPVFLLRLVVPLTLGLVVALPLRLRIDAAPIAQPLVRAAFDRRRPDGTIRLLDVGRYTATTTRHRAIRALLLGRVLLDVDATTIAQALVRAALGRRVAVRLLHIGRHATTAAR